MNEGYELKTKACRKIQDTTNQILKSIEPKIPYMLHIGSWFMRQLKFLMFACVFWIEGAALMYVYLGTDLGSKICPCNLGPIREVPVGSREAVPDAEDESAPTPLTRPQAFRMRPDPK